MTPLRQRICALLFGALSILSASFSLSAHAEEGPDASLKGPAWLAPRSGPKLAKPVAVGQSVGLGRSAAVLLLTSILGGAALYLRSRKQKPSKARLSELRVLGATKLGGRAQLVLAEVAGRKILLGVTDASVRKLAWLESEAEIADSDPYEAAAPPRLVSTAGARAGAPSAAPFSGRAKLAVTPVAKSKRSFRDFLANAVGNIGRPDDESAASLLAAETEDTFTRSTPRGAGGLEASRRSAPAAPPSQRNANPQMLDVEGQARGLLARLGDPRA